MADVFMRGGILMYPLLLFSILITAVIIYKVIEFSRLHISRRYMEKIAAFADEHGTDAALELLQEEGSPVYELAAHLKTFRINETETAGLLEDIIETEGAVMMERAERYVHLLSLVGRIAPMIGLFGTVLGLSRTFYDVSQFTTSVSPVLLSGGIWEAMITTIAGLTVGIPSQIAHHLLAHQVESWGFSARVFAESCIFDRYRGGLETAEAALPEEESAFESAYPEEGSRQQAETEAVMGAVAMTEHAAGMDPDDEVKAETGNEPEADMEHEPEMEPEADMEPEMEAEPEAEMETELDMEPEFREEKAETVPIQQEETELKTESEVWEEPAAGSVPETVPNQDNEQEQQEQESDTSQEQQEEKQAAQQERAETANTEFPGSSTASEQEPAEEPNTESSSETKKDAADTAESSDTSKLYSFSRIRKKGSD